MISGFEIDSVFTLYLINLTVGHCVAYIIVLCTSKNEIANSSCRISLLCDILD